MKKETPACVAMHPKTRQWFVVDATLGDYGRAAGPTRANLDRAPASLIVSIVLIAGCALVGFGMLVAGSAQHWWPLVPVIPLAALGLLGCLKHEKSGARSVQKFDNWLEEHQAQRVTSIGRQGMESIAKMVHDTDFWRREATKGARWGGNDPNTGATEIAALTRAVRQFTNNTTDANLLTVGWAFEKAEKAHDRVLACELYDVSSPAHLSRIVRGRTFERTWRGPRELGWI